MQSGHVIYPLTATETVMTSEFGLPKLVLPLD